MGKAKITFAAIPARAVGDPRLKGLHLKVLGAVALHDRLSGARKNGQGCWAGNKRLAELIGCNYSRLSVALTDLATWGYIDRRANPMNKTRRILFIVYDERDDAFVKANRDDNPLPTGKQSAADNSLPTGEEDAETVCPVFQTSHEYQPLGGGEYIQQKLGRNSAEAGNGYSAEAEDAGERRKEFSVRACEALIDDDEEADDTFEERAAIIHEAHTRTLADDGAPLAEPIFEITREQAETLAAPASVNGEFVGTPRRFTAVIGGRS